MKRIYLSSPHLSPRELELTIETFESNWIAPLGPNVDAFEAEFCTAVGAKAALATNSGTAALHLALRMVGVQPGDEVFCSTLTFVASANPICYLGAKPVFIDSDRISWNMNPDLLRQALDQRARVGKLPKAVVLVHLYGQSADIDPILAACNQYEVPLIEDAAESLGATYKGRSPGTFGQFGIYSFNGNKIITTSGGGMLVANQSEWIEKARFLSSQARDPAPHYQHSEIGYNYRLSNVLAAIGRGQLSVLDQRVNARRKNFQFYQHTLGQLPGVKFMPEADFGRSTRWLSCLTIDSEKFGCDRDQICLALAEHNIESRPVWKPLHLQPVFADCESIGGEVSEALFEHGLCLPSGSNLTPENLTQIVNIILTQQQACSSPCPNLV